MNKLYVFVGGPFNGQTLTEESASALHTQCGTGFSEDLSAIRANGGLVHREELDNEFEYEGYLGPMWDGERYFVDSTLKYSWQCTEDEKTSCPGFYVLRYETQEVYDMLSR